MAGAALSLSLEELAGFLDRKAEALHRLNLTKSLRVLLVAAKASIKENFAAGHAPDGTPWLPLKRPRQGKRHKGSSPLPLRDSGLLMASTTSAGPHHVETVTASSMEVGSNLEYAGLQNFGGTVHQEERSRAKPWVFTTPSGDTVFTRRIKAHDVTVPARPFLGWSDKLIATAGDILGEHLENEVW